MKRKRVSTERWRRIIAAHPASGLVMLLGGIDLASTKGVKR